MTRRALPVPLALAALLSDLQGAHAVALVVLLAAIPAAFVLTLDCYGDTIAARCGLVRPGLAAAGLALLVFSAALRSPAVVGGVPRIAVSAVVLALFVYASILLTGKPRRVAGDEARPESEDAYAEAA